MKARKLIVRDDVLIKGIVGSTGGVSDKNSVSFYKFCKTYHNTLVLWVGDFCHFVKVPAILAVMARFCALSVRKWEVAIKLKSV